MDCLLQFCLLSGIMQGMQSSLPQWAPAARSVENMFFSFTPPASWNLTRNLVILTMVSSLSFNILISVFPLLEGTNITLEVFTPFVLWLTVFVLLLYRRIFSTVLSQTSVS